MPLAARVGDRISHSNVVGGLVAGAVAGAAIGALCVTTGGVGAIALGAAAGAGLGGALGGIVGSFAMSDVGAITSGSTDTITSGKGAARATDSVSCSQHGAQKIAEGSGTVLIDGLPAARLRDRITCGAVISSASGDVNIGGSAMAALPMGVIPPPPLGIDKLLGPDTAALVAKSPSLTADMRALEADGWKVVTGDAGKGTSADRTRKTITVDANQLGNPKDLTQSLSHEVGHARYNPSIDMSSKAAYMRSTLADEGAATLSNVRAQREIQSHGGPDIGIAGNPANGPAYSAAYDQYLRDGDGVKARDTIGSIFGSGERTSTTNQTYSDYYGSWYDRNHPGH